MANWAEFLEQETQKTYLKDTLNYVNKKRVEGIVVYPPENEIFSAFSSTPFEQTKVVILGQDPYHGANQAHGLCFSVLPHVKVPPSLANIYKELAEDIASFSIPTHGYLQPWAEQGVLLLNTVLTVEEGQPHSHKHLGWETFTDNVLSFLNEKHENIVFILWGAHAHKKGKYIDETKHFVVKGPHPSPLSAYRGFFGCRHFSKTNKILIDLGKTPINWQV